MGFGGVLAAAEAQKTVFGRAGVYCDTCGHMQRGQRKHHRLYNAQPHAASLPYVSWASLLLRETWGSLSARHLAKPISSKVVHSRKESGREGLMQQPSDILKSVAEKKQSAP